MKILHIINCLDEGGVESIMTSICLADTSNIHQVIALKSGGIYLKILNESSIPVISIDIRKNPYNWVRLGVEIKKFDPDVVQTWMYHSNLIGGIFSLFFSRAEIFWAIHNGSLIFGKSKLSTILINFIGALLSHLIPKKIIYCADSSKIYHENIGYCKSKGLTIYNGYNFNHFNFNLNSRKSIRNTLNLPPDRFVIGFVSRFDPIKDIDNLLNSLSILKIKNVNFSVLMIGLGLDESNSILLNRIMECGLKSNIFLLGTQKNINEYMSAFDVLVLSSRQEAFPNVVSESMGCQTPCISTNVGDVSSIINNLGWVVPVQNSKLLADAIINSILAWHKIESWNKLRLSARGWVVSNFSYEVMLNKYRNSWDLNKGQFNE